MPSLPVRRALIIGSGPSAAATALALSRENDLAITVLEPGLRLEPERARTVETLATHPPSDWDRALVDLISRQPERTSRGVLPEKRVFGSDFPFRDVGQRNDIAGDEDINLSVVSAAYGGFSNVWGAQVMPFAASVFDDWPITASEMESHYRAVLGEIPYAAEVDDLSVHFPLLHEAEPLPPVSDRTARVLATYGRHRRRVEANGVTVGKARLALRAASCVQCGLCMTGCPFGLIYSSSQTFERLRADQRVAYHAGLLATKVSEDETVARVEAIDLDSGQRQVFEAERVYVACGAIGTTQLAANSLRLFNTEITMRESRQFTLPFLSARAGVDPQREPQFTLNQFNMTVSFDDRGYDLAQLHFYTYNPLFEVALPGVLRGELARIPRRELLRRLSFAIGYLPSWRSPSLAVKLLNRDAPLPQVSIRSEGATYRNRMLRHVITRLVRAAPFLDLYPVLPMLRVAGGAKSYHFGGSFPHTRSDTGTLSTDRLGRPWGWHRIHLVDGSVFPTVPATTFTLTVMANAHRIAVESIAAAS